jgi:hypothetical protein
MSVNSRLSSSSLASSSRILASAAFSPSSAASLWAMRVACALPVSVIDCRTGTIYVNGVISMKREQRTKSLSTRSLDFLHLSGFKLRSVRV